MKTLISNRAIALALVGLTAGFWLSCNKSPTETPEKQVKNWKCGIASGANPAYADTVGCREDFEVLASEPLDASIPGALSMKTVVDLSDGGTLYFQNSKTYKIHWEFISKNLSGNGKPLVPALSSFNLTEYFSPNRRFVLGAVTLYQGPGIWTYEIAPYDNASAEMITLAMNRIAAACYCGDSLYFHPTSQTIEAEAKNLPDSIKVIATDSLYAGIDYQPLNFGTSYGRLIFTTAKKLETEYVSFRDIVVLDAVPNDISVTSGIITQEFQTPLSHINVLSQNRGTPNMALRGAYTHADLLALKNKWVKFTVNAQSYSVTEVTQEEADKWWEENRPPTVGIARLDTTIRDLRDIENILDTSVGLAKSIKEAIPTFGGKASHFGAFPLMNSTQIRFNKAFAIPVYHYWHHMQRHGLNDTVSQWLADPVFQGDPAERDKRLARLRGYIRTLPLDTAFAEMLMEKLRTKYPSTDRIRFRSSTNAEDLEGFTGAGLYESYTGSMTDPNDHVLDELRRVWSGVWFFRSFEERSYRNIDHVSVGMAVLVHRAHPEEEANGVAVTSNPFDISGVEPAFYVNAQIGGEYEVVAPPAGVTSDQFLYYYDMPGQPTVFMARSNQVPQGTTVLTPTQTYELGKALSEIRRFFTPVYGKDPSKWWGMEVDFKLDQAEDDPNGPLVIIIKQARDYPGWGQ